MLTQLSTVKTRLAIELPDLTFDALLLRAIVAVSARFDLETNRTLARTENFTFEFPPEDGEILLPCYPIESITKFEIKVSEAGGWIQQGNVEYLIRRQCILSFPSPLTALQPAAFNPSLCLARITYTGGYLLPGSDAVVGATPLPVELEQAAIEQTVFWFQTRDKPGLLRQWPKGGSYEQFADPDLLPSVRATLERYRRFAL
jgi:hypothetical protein